MAKQSKQSNESNVAETLSDLKVEVVPTVEAPVATQEGNVMLAPTPVVQAVPTYDPEHLKTLTSVSSRIRYLNSRGLTNSQITKVITNAKGEKLLYQHVRNVLNQKVKTPVAG